MLYKRPQPQGAHTDTMKGGGRHREKWALQKYGEISRHKSKLNAFRIKSAQRRKDKF